MADERRYMTAVDFYSIIEMSLPMLLLPHSNVVRQSDYAGESLSLFSTYPNKLGNPPLETQFVVMLPLKS